MEKNKLRKKLKNTSVKDETWISKAKYRKENKSWMDFSFDIAVRIASILEQNKESGKHPKTQKELAMLMDCTAQYVNKILRGKENLTLETIVKIEAALNGVSLIEASNPIDLSNISIEITEIATPRTDFLFTNYLNTNWVDHSYSGVKEYKHTSNYSDKESTTAGYNDTLPWAA